MTGQPAVLSESAWRDLQALHEERVRPWIEPRLRRRACGQSHPVDDFLFDYYSYPPASLRRWNPGFGIALLGAGAREFLKRPGYRLINFEAGQGVIADPRGLPVHRRESARWILDLLQATRDRPPHFGCFGLHEWAMVYRQSETEVRHPSWPLRFPPEKLARILEDQPLRCTHFDAFRFFTPEARPLNRVQPERPLILGLEQRGCLHVNMDLYKWACKLSPFVASELLADCFSLARDLRSIDMRASPYDLRGLGLDPIRIEEPEGRAEYERQQRLAADRAIPLRERLIASCENLLTAAETAEGSG